MKIKAVLFDLDGTLADSIADIAASANLMFKTFGYPEYSADEYKYLVGEGLTALIERALPDGKATPEELNKFRKLWLDHYGMHCLDQTRAYDGMAETLADLKRRGIALGVVTNKQQEIAKKIVTGLYGDNIFGCVCGIRKGVPHKPDPTLVYEALSILGITNSGEVIFIGDTSTDIKTAKNSGCVSVGALWGFRPASELIEAGADHIIEAPPDLLRLCT